MTIWEDVEGEGGKRGGREISRWEGDSASALVGRCQEARPRAEALRWEVG